MFSLDAVYRSHHEHERGKGFMLFPDIRAAFFRREIGIGKRVLDLGCRDGALTRMFSSGNEVLGVDIDSAAVAACRASGIRAEEADLNAESWSFADGSFDAVVIGEVLEHVYYPERFLLRCARALAPGGVLVGSTPNAFSLKNRVRLFLGRKRGTPLEDPTHINHFSYQELLGLLQKTGFAACRVEPLIVKRWVKPFRVIAPGLAGFSFLFRAEKPRGRVGMAA